MTLDGDSISIEDVDRLTVEQLISLYEAKHPGKLSQVVPSSPVQVIGMVSKEESAVHP